MQEKNFIPIIELKKEIRENLEKNRSYDIDKKTVRRIVTTLESEGLVEVKYVEIVVSYDEAATGTREIDSPIRQQDSLMALDKGLYCHPSSAAADLLHKRNAKSSLPPMSDDNYYVPPDEVS